MANPIAMGLHGAAQAARFGWYFSLNRMVRWETDRMKLRPSYRPSRPVPSERAILAALANLFRRDAEAVRDGLFPPIRDGLSTFEAIDRARSMLADLPGTLRRRAGGEADTVRETMPAQGLPDYYVRDFHFQTGGYLSSESARIYDVQVETLFLGGAAPMRREALRPIADFLRGRDQRQLALVDVGCGTGRFLRDVRLAWPALRLTGIDLSESYLAEAQRFMSGLRPARLLEANAEAMPLPDESQDIATAIFLFHELPPEARRQVIAEMSRVLKPGGMLILVDSLQLGDRPDWDGLIEAFPTRFHEPYFESYASEDLGQLLEDAGLRPHAVWTSFLSKVIVYRKPLAA